MFKRCIMYILAALAGTAAAFVISGFFMVAEVTGSGMEPELEDGSHVIVSKKTFKEDIPEKGALVVFECDVCGEGGEGHILVRRVAGTEGDEVQIRDGIFYLNGKQDKDYSGNDMYPEDMKKKKLKKDDIFVLCDNRSGLLDSRDGAVGILKKDKCIGTVCFK